MWSLAVAVFGILLEHLPQVPIPEDEEVVQALAPDTPEKPLHDRVHSWCPVSDAHLLDATRLGHARERRPELAVVVPNQMLGVVAEGGGLP